MGNEPKNAIYIYGTNKKKFKRLNKEQNHRKRQRKRHRKTTASHIRGRRICGGLAPALKPISNFRRV